MLPPIDQDVLSANPKFNALYNDLCKNKLNSDGTSKLDAKAERDHDTLSQDLRKARVEAAKRDLIKSGLHDLSYRGDELPEDLQHVVAAVAALLDDRIADDDRYLLQDDLKKFQDNVKQINTALSKQFKADATVLAALIDPDNPPLVDSLTTSINGLRSSITDNELILSESRRSLAQEASKLHELYRQVIERSIRVLEQTIHGSVARSAKAKADYLALVAEGMSKKLSLQHEQLMSQLHSPGFEEALERKLNELQDENRFTKKKIREAEEKLEQYGRVAGMNSVAKEYADILRETEKVRADIARLEKARS